LCTIYCIFSWKKIYSRNKCAAVENLINLHQISLEDSIVWTSYMELRLCLDHIT
jgi:hypothetical protein